MTTTAELQKHALAIRRDIIRMVTNAGSGHIAGPLGLADIFAAFYFDILRYDPANPLDPNRDLLVLSNGHCVPAQYAALAEAGLIPREELMTLRKIGSRLQGHPEREKLPWLETTSGPLGCGIALAAGMAHVIQNIDKQQRGRFVYAIASDGEMDEGNTWEAALFASKYKLGNLIVTIDRNNIQIEGETEDVMPLGDVAAKFRAFGWHALEVDGNNIEAFVDATAEARAVTDKPTAIVAHTIPGKGVDFMEFDYRWHGRAPNEKEMKEALAQLS